jgi:hypothetical protein
MMFKRRPEEGWDQRPRLAERKVNRRGPGLDAVEKRGEARKGRGDEIVEISERGPIRHTGGLRYGVVRGNGSPETKKN